MLHPNDPSESISRGNRSNHESLWLWDAKFVKALHSRSTRLETVPFNARRYSRETPSPIVLAEKEEEEEESIRGEKRRGDQQGETKEWRTAVDELCRASEPTAFFFLLSPSILSTNPPTQGLFIRSYTSFFPPADYVCAAWAYESSRWRWAKPSPRPSK